MDFELDYNDQSPLFHLLSHKEGIRLYIVTFGKKG